MVKSFLLLLKGFKMKLNQLLLAKIIVALVTFRFAL